MAQPKWLKKYLTMKPEVTRIYDDLDAYLDYCRITLQPFTPTDLYRKESATYQAYLNSKRWSRPYNNNRPRNNNYDRRNNGQNFSR
jgi:hypothetical protein